MKDNDVRDKIILLALITILSISILGLAGRSHDTQLELQRSYEAMKVKDDTIIDIQDTVKMYEDEINELYNKLEECGSHGME